tara:strand:- start:3272 stop:5155 length:1884 start_codon:yes stop_codon:yes gene_type:complete
MAIGDPISAGIGSYDPSVNYFAQPQTRGAGLLGSGGLNIATVPGQSKMDALNALRERLGRRAIGEDRSVPLDAGIGTRLFSIAPTGMTKGQAKQQQMTVGDFNIARKLAALSSPNIMTQTTAALQDDPSAFEAGLIDPLDLPNTYVGDDIPSDLVLGGGTDDMGSGVPLGGSYPEGEGITGTSAKTGTGTTDAEAEAFRKAEQKRASMQGMQGIGSDTSTDGQPQAPTSAFEKALAEAMKDYEDAKAGEDTGNKDIEYYKNEFAKATGIDTSGKVDKSQALMAFGLALMQNKAGKGFDVGKVLSEVGAAGEKAQPLLAKAQSEARAAQLAGGKYALTEMAKDEAAKKASVTAALQRVQALQDKAIDAQDKINLEILKGQLNAQKERIKAEGAVQKAMAEKGDPDLYTDKTESIPLFEDAPDAFKITAFIQDPNAKGDIPVKLTNGSIAGLRAQFNSSELALNKAEDELAKLADIVGTKGITTQQQIAAYLNSFGRGLGMNVDKSLDPVAEAKIILERIATQQAPQILGEAGKTISDADRERVTRIVGDIGLLEKADSQVIMKKLESVYGLIVQSGRNNLDTAYNKLYAMGYNYGPYEQQQQQQQQQSQSGAFTPNNQQQQILNKYGI